MVFDGFPHPRSPSVAKHGNWSATDGPRTWPREEETPLGEAQKRW